jgi:hypothetical protein
MKWLTIILILIATPALAEIRIQELDVIGVTEETTEVANIVTAIANAMSVKPRSLTFCIDTWDHETCCTYIPGEDDYTCRHFSTSGGEG